MEKNCDQIAVKKYIFDTLSIEELIPPVSHYHHREEIFGEFEAIKHLRLTNVDTFWRLIGHPRQIIFDLNEGKS